MDEAKVQETCAWLTKAVHDLESAEWLRARSDPLCEVEVTL